ncbi:hypothetical protein FRE64_09800 [Euhalothece natronophila Z-M001]|uniref:Uncharacterized protein n=1 Tax=Euhalothece natronophila Z-M001 TaxID=522448 RepID=A0A5B8NPY4_9CHRO|nr:hypothetical protein FRE64_09800 [Euhalothece natronophila Z-M001]
MRTTNNFPSACRYCRHYAPQGHRGGMCQKLSAPVRGDWQACSLAHSPFMPTWETWETITLLESSSFKAVKVAETKDSETTVNSEIEKKSKTVLSA